MKSTQKTNEKMTAITILGEIKEGRPKKGQKMHGLKAPKRGKELVFLMVGSYFTHNPFYVTNMQIVKSNNSGRSRINITCQCNFFLFISKAKACWRVILTHYLKN
jgi:hypothetical protein